MPAAASIRRPRRTGRPRDRAAGHRSSSSWRRAGAIGRRRRLHVVRIAAAARQLSRRPQKAPVQITEPSVAAAASSAPSCCRLSGAPGMRPNWSGPVEGQHADLDVSRARADLDARRSVLLTAYGGFTSALTPAFDPADFLWLDSGGTIAVPAPERRGYGESWHQAGMLERKQNVSTTLSPRRNGCSRADARPAGSRSKAPATAACWSAP